jgi:hypothetical protein
VKIIRLRIYAHRTTEDDLRHLNQEIAGAVQVEMFRKEYDDPLCAGVEILAIVPDEKPAENLSCS